MIFAIVAITALYLLARNRQYNYGNVPPEDTWWAEQRRLAKEYEKRHPMPHGGRSHYRRRD